MLFERLFPESIRIGLRITATTSLLRELVTE
jgi:hypothetical protein